MVRLALCILVHVALSRARVPGFEVESVDQSSSRAAKAQLMKIQEQGQNMRYGTCWTSALKILESGCRHLTDETQRRIAYAFMRCHLLASGRKVADCPESSPVSECTEGETLSDLAFSTYTEFFTHSQQICFHLQNQAWQEATENTIDRLADNSHDVADRLEQTSATAAEMMERQNKSLKNQELLLKNEQRLKESMQQSLLDVKRSHSETKQIMNEQRLLFREVFDRVAVLQKTVLGEFSSIYTFAFYIGSTILAYILTSTTRTSAARFWVFLIVIANAITERMICNRYIEGIDGVSGITIVPELMQEEIWLCRKIFTILAASVLIITVHRFKDYNKINNSLLNDIIRQNQQLQNYIHENIRGSSKMIASPSEFEQSDSETVICAVENKATHNSDDSFRESDIEESDSSTILSVSSSVSTVLTNISRRSSTPLRDLSSLSNRDSLRGSRNRGSTQKTRRRSSILAVVKESEEILSKPLDSMTVSNYNLRRRPNNIRADRDMAESVEEFTSLMLEGIAEQSALRRNRIQRYLHDNHK